MFSDDLKNRMEKMEQEVDRLKSLQTEVMRVSFQIANLSDKMEARFNSVDVKLASVDNSIQSLDKRLGRLEMLFYGLLVGIVTVFVGGLATVLGLPYLKTGLF
ncbi:MAG: hypothetical protein JO235_26150 [Chroococcidiopsidaceae cyanobacterium CP_BM_RX_35]|nr:hypothetical protein [Chroococcidiopsidaceae cyanobacterium CP_BM_RX_35]